MIILDRGVLSHTSVIILDRGMPSHTSVVILDRGVVQCLVLQDLLFNARC